MTHPGHPLVDDDIRHIWTISVKKRLRAEQIHHAMQAALLILSALAVALVAHGTSAKWILLGNVLGALSQPLWLWATWRARQWGMFFLAFFYLGVWALGITRHLHAVL